MTEIKTNNPKLMQTYIAIDVPLRNNAKWRTRLRSTLGTHFNDIQWRDSHPHLTLAFMKESPSEKEVLDIVSSYLKQTKAKAPTIAFDKLDVFLTYSGDRYIVNLTTTHIPKSFLTLTNDIRSSLKKHGAVLTTDFRFHVTLCEIQDVTIDINTIKECLESVMLPPFSLSLTHLEYRYFRGETIKEWRLPIP